MSFSNDIAFKRVFAGYGYEAHHHGHQESKFTPRIDTLGRIMKSSTTKSSPRHDDQSKHHELESSFLEELKNFSPPTTASKASAGIPQAAMTSPQHSSTHYTDSRAFVSHEGNHYRNTSWIDESTGTTCDLLIDVLVNKNLKIEIIQHGTLTPLHTVIPSTKACKILERCQ